MGPISSCLKYISMFADRVELSIDVDVTPATATKDDQKQERKRDFIGSKNATLFDAIVSLAVIIFCVAYSVVRYQSMNEASEDGPRLASYDWNTFD